MVAGPSPLGSAVRGHCPRCDSPGLFSGWIRFAPKCRDCGLDYEAFNVGDGPAAFLILIIGALVTTGAITLELGVEPPFWVHFIWVPITAALTILGLRLGKAWLLAQEYANQAREGRIAR